MELERTHYDVILLGTGVTQSIVAGACARIGKSVLHIDVNNYYGGSFATFTLKDLKEWIKTTATKNHGTKEDSNLSGDDNSIVCKYLSTLPGNDSYNNVVLEQFVNSETAPQESTSSNNGSFWEDVNLDLANLSRFYNIDLEPKLLFSRGVMVELLISSNVSRYLAFKSLEQLYIRTDDHWEKVPLSKEDVFSSQSISLIDKRLLMKFLTFCNDYENNEQEHIDSKDKSFKEFLAGKRLSPKLQNFILRAIALYTGKEENLKVEEGLKRVKQHLKSLKRYGNTAFIVPVYGSSELAQAFCRLCAIFGGTYVLQHTPTALLFKEDQYHGILFENQNITSTHLVAEVDYIPSTYLSEKSIVVAHAILVIDKEFHSPLNNADSNPSENNEGAATSQESSINFSIIPPSDEHPYSISIYQGTNSTSACPTNQYVLYVSTIVDANQNAKKVLGPVLEKLLQYPESRNSNSDTPKVLFQVFFDRAIREARWKEDKPLSPSIHLCSDVSTEIDFDNCCINAKEIFEKLYPNEEFLPPAPNPEDELEERMMLEEEEQHQQQEHQGQEQEQEHQQEGEGQASSSASEEPTQTNNDSKQTSPSSE